MGIYLRVTALVGMGYTLSKAESGDVNRLLILIFYWISIFSISGAFAGISYTDILGKSFVDKQREKFLVFKEFLTAVGMLVSAVVVRQLVIHFPYPDNYIIIFFIASGLLFVATFGFMMIREAAVVPNQMFGVLNLIRKIPTILTSDKSLINYIIVVNLTSLGLTTIPFFVAFSKQQFGLNSQQLGSIILLQFIGMILSTPFWNAIAKRYMFKGIAYGTVLTGGILPFLVIILSFFNASIYQWVFLVAGFLMTAQRIYIQGMLLEITSNENRALYAGISGALSITTAFFPLIAGILIQLIGYIAIFVIISPLTLSAFYFLRKIRCKRLEGKVC